MAILPAVAVNRQQEVAQPLHNQAPIVSMFTMMRLLNVRGWSTAPRTRSFRARGLPSPQNRVCSLIAGEPLRGVLQVGATSLLQCRTFFFEDSEIPAKVAL